MIIRSEAIFYQISIFSSSNSDGIWIKENSLHLPQVKPNKPNGVQNVFSHSFKIGMKSLLAVSTSCPVGQSDGEGHKMERSRALLMEMQIGAATMGKSMVVAQKIKNRTAVWRSNFTSRYTSKKTKTKPQNANLKEYLHICIYCSIIYNSQHLEATQVPINRWVDKKVLVPIYNGILHSHK